MFNLFYKDIIYDLECQISGCSINNMSFNVLCYADDLLLVGATISGLQRLIRCADNYVTN